MIQPFRAHACAVLLALFTSLTSPVIGALAVNPIFRSNMVLQAGMTVPVFGTGDVGSSVTVQFKSQNVSTVVTANGKWQVGLTAMNASAVGDSLTITGAGSPPATFTGVQVGEVWLCSGQSNMGKPLSYADESAPVIADAGNHNIRLFRMIAGNGPGSSSWTISNSSTAASFSAVGYWHGLELSQKLNVPIGLIQATHDGTNISEWQTTNGGTGADYLAMVKAIQPFAIRGVVWYQGESNGGDAAYQTKLTAMINEWRSNWGLPNLPFGIVQLPSTKWEAARIAQFNVTQTVGATYLTVITDLPGGNQLHPTAKKQVGIRLAIGARGFVYGEGIEYAGPVPWLQASSVNGNKVVLNFLHPGNGLITSNGGAPTTFQIMGATGRYVAATATIVGNTIEVTSSVAAPKHVRYGFGGIGNFFNSVNIPVEGGASSATKLPASMFQIDFP